MHARPVPADPYNPLPLIASSHGKAEGDTIRHPSPFIPIRLPIFALVMWLNDGVIKIFSVGGGHHQRKGSTGFAPGSGLGVGRNRAFSDPDESVEKGEVAELVGMKSNTTARSRGGRINIGRRKAD